MVLGVLAGGGGLYFFECYKHQQAMRDEAFVQAMEPSVVDVFRFTLEEEVKKKLGQPVEGYEPQMFLEVFPGLALTDFDGVESNAGLYQVENGELSFVPDASKLQHSASGAIGKQGLATLLENVAARTKIDLAGTGTLTDIMRAITGS